jgi:hypothetical protein
MKESSDEKVAIKGIILVTIFQILVMLFFHAIN